MKSALRLAAPLAALFMTAPLAAHAQNAILTDDATLRAGPGFDFPRVAHVPEDARVNIHGCLRGFSWCDISWRGERGWIDASRLSYLWDNRYVVVGEWGPRIGLPVIAYSVENYWSRYYRDRPWWNQRHAWFERDGRWGERHDRDWRRGDRDGWRDRQRGDGDDWRDRRTGQRDHDMRQGHRDLGDDGRPGSRGREMNGDDERRGRQAGQNPTQRQEPSRQGGAERTDRDRGGDNAPTGRIPDQRQPRGQENRM